LARISESILLVDSTVVDGVVVSIVAVVDPCWWRWILFCCFKFTPTVNDVACVDLSFFFLLLVIPLCSSPLSFFSLFYPIVPYTGSDNGDCG
jgi:hypothetical protein